MAFGRRSRLWRTGMRREESGGVAPLGLGKRAGPAGDKFSRSEDAGNGGRVRSGAQRNEAPRTSLCRIYNPF